MKCNINDMLRPNAERPAECCRDGRSVTDRLVAAVAILSGTETVVSI